MTPTINTALLSHATSQSRPGYHGNGYTQWGRGGGDHTTSNNTTDSNASGVIINDIRNSTSGLSHSESVSLLPQGGGDRRGSFSTSTMETTLGVTPGDAPSSHPPLSQPSHPKAQNTNVLMNQHIPRHQGRNPIAERNTHKRSDEELAVVGEWAIQLGFHHLWFLIPCKQRLNGV